MLPDARLKERKNLPSLVARERLAVQRKRPKIGYCITKRHSPEAPAMALLNRTHPWRSFHGAWAAAMARLLNQGVLPPGYYAVPARRAGRACRN
jgi:hypothetical protein